ncbi:MAG TPA: CPBP family glutamic-type intramembrane protease [Planctomycetota bacterium]|nr:CPBP family glutamic-type intramembrane protease [Planctomycetota bacterium]
MAARSNPAAMPPARDSGHPLSPAYLAMLPMFLCYELSLSELGGARRNAAEVLLGLWLEPVRPWADGIRWGMLAAFALVALYFCRAHAIRVRDAVARIWLEGLVAALTLGPLLIGMTALATRWTDRLDVSWDSSRAAPGLATGAFFFGGAVYEELVFRVGLYGLFYWTFVRVARGLNWGEREQRLFAEPIALVGSAIFFAGFHFRRFTHWLWDGGMEFSAPLFLWLACAGILLGLIYRLRGPGVAAWAHGLFNLGLLVGIDPDVLA